MSEIYFENVVQIGNLYLEKVFDKFEDENIIFVCKDIHGDRYLCICYEFRLSLKWVLCKITPEMLVRLIARKIDIRSVFELEHNNLISIVYINNEESSEVIAINTSNEYILPKYGVFLKTSQDTLKYLRFICFNFTKTSSYKCERFLNYTIGKSKPIFNTVIDECDINSNMFISYDLNNIDKSKEKELSFINLDDAA